MGASWAPANPLHHRRPAGRCPHRPLLPQFTLSYENLYYVPVPSFYIYLCSEFTLPIEVPYLKSSMVANMPINIQRGAWSRVDHGYSNLRSNVGPSISLNTQREARGVTTQYHKG